MAGIKFFDLTEKATLKQPSIFALMIYFAVFFITGFFMRNSIFWFMAVAIVEYVIVIPIFNSPFRNILGYILHASRDAIIVASSTEKDELWMKLNKPTFEKMGVKIYEGEDEWVFYSKVFNFLLNSETLPKVRKYY